MRRSSVYGLAKTYRVGTAAAPGVPHDAEVWHVRPFSQSVDVLSSQRHDAEDRATLFRAIDDAPRILVDYLAELLTAGRTDTVTEVLHKRA